MAVNLYGRKRTALCSQAIMMQKTLKCPIRVVWVYRRTQWIALFTTDLSLSVTEIIEYYGARWKIDIFQPYCLHKFQGGAAILLFSHVSGRSTVWDDPYIQAVA